MDWVRAEVDGVPVFWSRHASAQDDQSGGMRAGLVFRVGQADESLPSRGITHLIEHLALHRISQPLDHVNGQVDPTTTTFYRTGSAEDVVAFVSMVCQSLRDVPVDRMATEVRLLRTEAAGRVAKPMAPLLVWRYGATSYGVCGYDEFGLGHHSDDDLRAWAASRFTRGNATLWLIGGPPPAGLHIDLPAGPRFAAPAPSNALPRTPAYFPERVNGVGMLTVTDRSIAASAYTVLLRRRLYQALRVDNAISYSPAADYEPRDAHHAHISAFADGLAETHEQLVTGFVEVVDQLAETPISDAELDELITTTRKGLTDNRAAASLTINAAVAELLGSRPSRRAELEVEIDQLTPESLQATAVQARDNALLMVPGPSRPPGNRYSAAPHGSPGTVDGYVLLPAAEGRGKLVVGPTGVSRAEGLRFITVKFADCQLMHAWPDGSRQLFGSDGFNVYVDPANWQDGHIAPGIIDANVAPSVVLVQPARPGRRNPLPPQPVAATPSQPTPRRGLFRRR